MKIKWSASFEEEEPPDDPPDQQVKCFAVIKEPSSQYYVRFSSLQERESFLVSECYPEFFCNQCSSPPGAQNLASSVVYSLTNKGAKKRERPLLVKLTKTNI